MSSDATALSLHLNAGAMLLVTLRLLSTTVPTVGLDVLPNLAEFRNKVY